MRDPPKVVENNIPMRIQETFRECSQKECEQLYKDVLNCVTNKAAYVSDGSSKKLTMLRKDMGITICMCSPSCTSDIIMKYIVFIYYFIRYFLSW